MENRNQQNGIFTCAKKKIQNSTPHENILKMKLVFSTNNREITTISRLNIKVNSKAVVLNQEWFCSPRDIWQHLGTFWVVTIVCWYWHLVGKVHAAKYPTVHSTATTKNYPAHNVYSAKVFLKQILKVKEKQSQMKAETCKKKWRPKKMINVWKKANNDECIK